jgi:hypothetical protein
MSSLLTDVSIGVLPYLLGEWCGEWWGRRCASSSPVAGVLERAEAAQALLIVESRRRACVPLPNMREGGVVVRADAGAAVAEPPRWAVSKSRYTVSSITARASRGRLLSLS